MSATVRNIGLYLAPRYGNRTDYKLILSLYRADHAAGGVPDGNLPLAVAERGVIDIDHSGFYVFNFDYPVSLSNGYYSITLHQQSDDETFPVDFKVNFVEWVYSPDTQTDKGVSAFSSDLQFTADVYGYCYGGHGLGSNYATVPLYGFGYGYNDPYDPLDFFNIFGIDGTDTGYALNAAYGYDFGFENTDLLAERTIQRVFKLYEEFNDIEFTGDNSAKINIPPAQEDVLTLDNRQDFLNAAHDGTEVINNLLTLKTFGERILCGDTSPLTSDCAKRTEVEWFPANFNLSSNDINYADVTNPLGNTSAFAVYFVASPSFSGIYVSDDGGSSWNAKNSGLTLDDNSERNFSCVKFGPNGSFIIAFDNTNDSERGKVFISVDLGESWTEIIGAGLSGITVNDAYVIDDTEIWIGTDDGVYRTTDGGFSWTPLNAGLPASTNVNQILVETDADGIYGYGYGGGTGNSFFDVFGETASMIGYGSGDFEDVFSGTLGYGYGYEYGFSGGSLRLHAIATDSGAYLYSGGIWLRIYPTIGDPDENINTILFSNNRIYVGRDNGVLRSEEFEGDIIFIGDDPRGEVVGGDPEKDFYINGLLRRKTTKLRGNRLNESNIFAGQHGGVFVSQNDGGDFVNITRTFEQRQVTDILLNPIDNRIVYPIVQTTKFSHAAVTFMIDCTGSMIANDPNNKRLDMITKIINEIVASATNAPFFQIIAFGLSEADLVRYNSIYTSLTARGKTFDVIGGFNLTGGLTANLPVVLNAVDTACTTQEHARTLFFDILAVTSEGLAESGASWKYVERDEDNIEVFKYSVNNIRSNFYSDLDKSLIMISDGNDTVEGKTLSDLIDASSRFFDIPADIYMVAIGHNINYENLNTLRESNKNAKLYLAPFDENIESTTEIDAADIILEREKFRRRTGQWSKLVDLGKKKVITKSLVSANVPPSTSCTYKLRSSDDKKTFSDFTNSLSVNTESSVDLSGRYIEIVVDFESLFTSIAPEVKQIDITFLEPSESFVYYPLIDLEDVERISEIELSSLDDESLGDIDPSEISLDFGIIQSNSTNFDFYNRVLRDKRSVLLKRDLEPMETDDGFIFRTASGAWPSDADVEIIDVGEFQSNPNSGVIEANRYHLIPSLGLVIFSKKVSSAVTLALSLSFINKYRLGLKIENRSSTNDCISLHDIAWTFYDDRTTIVPRPALPKVSSQLIDLDSFGVLAESNYPAAFGVTASYIVQYILREAFSSGTISVTTGLIYDIALDTDSDPVLRFYEQNAFLPQPSTIPTDDGLVRVLDGSGNELSNVSVTATQEGGFHYQTNVILDNVNVGESVIFNIGDISRGNQGLPTTLSQENLLFDRDDNFIGEIELNYIIGDSESTVILPDVNDGDFDKRITPAANLIGNGTTTLKLLAPSVVLAGRIFNFKILATDSQGLIDKNFTGTVHFGFNDSTVGSFTSGFSVDFNTSDAGCVELSGVISATATGSSRIDAGIVTNEVQAAATAFNPSLFTTTFPSNTIVFDSVELIRWGDLNISSIFSDGRQDLDFIESYARNTSKLDFIGFADDLDQLDNQEWKFTSQKASELNAGDLVVISGFRHRTNGFYGERVILFENIDDIPSNIITKPSSTVSPQSQIETLIANLTNSSYISIPIHSPYNTDDDDEIFRGRGFNFERYRDILLYNGGNNFVTQNETAVEIFSEHGSAENPDIYQNENFLSAEPNLLRESYVDQALLIGKRFGFTAGAGGYGSRPGYYKGDISPRADIVPRTNVHNKGLTGIPLNNLSRSNIISKIRNRECYATTGARMYLSYNGSTQSLTKTMGGVISNLSSDDISGKTTEKITLSFRVTSDNSTISRIEIIRITTDEKIETILDSRTSNEPPFNEVDFGTDTGTLSFVDDLDGGSGDLSLVVKNKELCYYLRISQADGQIAWSSPIWFNYGREDGIRTSIDISTRTIFDPTLGTPSGIIANIPFEAPAGGTLPNEHINDFFIPKTNVVRNTYADRTLYVSEKKTDINGLRLLSLTGANTNIVYGSHYLRFIPTSSLVSQEIIAGSAVNENVGAETFVFKPLNNGDTIDGKENLGKIYRNTWMGHMWQYSSDDIDFTDTGTEFSFEDDSIYVPASAEQTRVAMKPSMIQEGSKFYLFYSSSLIRYPEDPLAGGPDPKPNFEDRTQEDIISEDVVGLNRPNAFDTDPNQDNDWGENMRIHFAAGSGTSRNFLFDISQILPNTIVGNSIPIQFAHSPCIVKSDDDDAKFRIYYLGFHPIGGTLRLSMFCYKFNDISAPALGGETLKCFTFDSSVNNGTSFDIHNFVPYNSSDGISLDSWPEDPYYVISTNWLSVIKFDDGNYYAFFNYENTGSRSENVNIGGTGVLFSFDGEEFFEEDPNNASNSIPLKTGVKFAHPFKTTIGSQTDWYMTSQNSVGQIAFNKINWTNPFDVDIS